MAPFRRRDIRLVILDWFGVLNGEPTKLMIQQFGLSIDQIEGLRLLNLESDHGRMGTQKRLDRYLEILKDANDAPRTRDQMQGWLDANLNFDASLIAMVDHLREQDILVAIGSNADVDHESNLRRMGMGDHFDGIYVSSIIGRVKPAPGFFDYICDDMGVTTYNTLFIDDSAEHVAGARYLGLFAEQYGEYGDLSVAERIFAKHNLPLHHGTA